MEQIKDSKESQLKKHISIIIFRIICNFSGIVSCIGAAICFFSVPGSERASIGMFFIKSGALGLIISAAGSYISKSIIKRSLAKHKKTKENPI